MKVKKVIVGAVGVGVLGYLAYKFSSTAEAAAQGDPPVNPMTTLLNMERAAGEAALREEVREGIHLWGINPAFMAGLSAWNNDYIQSRHLSRPSREEAMIRINDMRNNRNINWTYVNDIYSQFPEYKPAGTPTGDVFVPNPPSLSRDNMQYKAQKMLWDNEQAQLTRNAGSLNADLPRGIRLGSQPLALRRSVGNTRIASIAPAHKEEMWRDFYSVLTYGWDKEDANNGEAFLIGIGGYPGFASFWRIPSNDGMSRLAPYRT